MVIVLKLVALAVACLLAVGLPVIAALLCLRWASSRGANGTMRTDSVAVIGAAVTVLAFLVVLKWLGCPDTSWLEPNPSEPGNIGIRWSRTIDGRAPPSDPPPEVR